MKGKPRILIVGDTILNRTYRGKPANEYRGKPANGYGGKPASEYHGKPANEQSAPFPFSYLSEEILYLERPPDETVQGVGYIARYFADSDTFAEVNVWTGTGAGPSSDKLKKAFADGCGDASLFNLDGEDTRTVTRILRNVSATRLWSEAPSYRSELRMDYTDGAYLRLESAVPRIRDALGSGDICLVRALSPRLFADTPEQTNAVLRQLQIAVQDVGARFIIDLRPLPPGLPIIDSTAVVLSTIGRLRDHRQVYRSSTDSERQDAAELVAESFWRLAPARALICFANSAGIIACERADAMKANLTKVPFSFPKEAEDGCGLVVAGDAFVAGAVDAIASGEQFPEAARRSAVAYMIAFSQSLGEPVKPAGPKSATAPRDTETWSTSNPSMNRLERALSVATEHDPWREELVIPRNGALAHAVENLTNALRSWEPRKGQDLIAVFGESRSGKERVLLSVLKSLEIGYVGPVNMHQLLAELRGCLNKLVQYKGRVALIVDEVSPGDSARSLLNLFAEKRHVTYASNEGEIDFRDYPVILLSSMRRDQMLDDLRGRLSNRAGITVPPLRDRWEEIPLVIAPHLKVANVFRRVQDVRISHRYLAAILFHSFEPREDIPEDLQRSGLDQRNFRALYDLIDWSIRRATVEPSEPKVMRIQAAHLPSPLSHLSSEAIPDDRYLVYRLDQPLIQGADGPVHK